MTTGEIPFLDLVTVHRELREELRSVFETALDTAGFVGGPAVQEFERDFAAFCECQFCVGMARGTDAVRVALVAAGVRPGDTVVTVPLTFFVTTEAISQAGARFDFVDVDARTYTMDPDRLRAYLETDCTPDPQTGRVVSKRTGSPVTAVVPVHLYGQMADMDPILELAARYDLIVIEDACQAHGAEYLSNKEDRWRKAGSMGRAAAFSFYPSKNLGACGEAGAVTTDDEQLARRCQMLRDHGQSRKYFPDIERDNGRRDSIQAAVLGWKRGDFPVSEEAANQILSLPMFAGLRSEDQHRVAEAVAGFASIRSASEAGIFPTPSHGSFGAKGEVHHGSSLLGR